MHDIKNQNGIRSRIIRGLGMPGLCNTPMGRLAEREAKHLHNREKLCILVRVPICLILKMTDMSKKGKRMNIAIIFDSMEDNSITPETMLCGQEMYLYCVKQVLIHPAIDAIIMAWREKETAKNAYERITQWKEAGLITEEKEIRILHGTENIQEIFAYLGKSLPAKINTYVLHSIRYPLITQEMIDCVLQNVETNGIAVTTQRSDDELVTGHDQRILSNADYRIIKYPAAIQGNNIVLESLWSFPNILQKMADCHPVMCETENRNIAIACPEDWELAEAVIKIKNDREGAYL